MGVAMARPMTAAASAAAAPSVTLMISMVGAKSARSRRMTMVGLTTRTAPSVAPASDDGGLRR